MNTTDESEYDYEYYSPISDSVRFTVLLTFVIPSIVCYIFVIGYILINKTLRSASNNYIILIILSISFSIVILDIPWEIDANRQSGIVILSSAFCLIWWFIDIGIFYTCQMLVTWASFERHILILHGRLLNQKWKKICFHYIPPLIIICYMMIFYIYAIFIFPCESYVDFENKRCLVPCYLDNPILGLWESIFHGIFTTIFILIFSGTLLIRVYRSKVRLQQLINWRKYRKMIFQLISISSLYLSINFPLCIIYFIHMTSFFDWTSTALECISFFSYFIPLFLPFICLLLLPGIWTKFKRLTGRRRNRQIQPIS